VFHGHRDPLRWSDRVREEVTVSGRFDGQRVSA
jgi:hypothetical protein